MYFSKWELESEAGDQAQGQADKQLRHEYLGEQPHREVHVVVLDVEVVPVPGHVEQVGHEGDLGDKGPEAPGEEVIDNPSIALDTGEHDPGEAEAPARLHHGLICLLFIMSGDIIRPINQGKCHEENK